MQSMPETDSKIERLNIGCAKRDEKLYLKYIHMGYNGPISFSTITIGGSTEMSAVWLIYWEISNHIYLAFIFYLISGHFGK